MDKVVRDGMVAVLVSPGFGAGWVTWESVNPFDPRMVEAIEAGVQGEDLVALATQLYPEDYHGGVNDLVIRWLPEGTMFRYQEYDGAESLELRDETIWIVA